MSIKYSICFLLSVIGFGAANACDVFDSFEEYRSSDFQLSELSPTKDKSLHDLYALWGSKQANQIAGRFSNLESPEKILSDLAASRKDLGLETGFGQSSLFGVLRTQADPLWTSGVSATESKNTTIVALLKLVKSKITEAERGNGEKFRVKYIWKPNTYTLENNVIVAANRLMLSEYSAISMEDFLQLGDKAVANLTSYYSVLHPSYADSQLILNDVLFNLKRLQTKSLTDAQRLKIFLKCLYGFYGHI